MGKPWPCLDGDPRVGLGEDKVGTSTWVCFTMASGKLISFRKTPGQPRL